MCQSSTGNGKSIKQREREQRGGWFSEETTGRFSSTTLFITDVVVKKLLFTSNPQRGQRLRSAKGQHRPLDKYAFFASHTEYSLWGHFNDEFSSS